MIKKNQPLNKQRKNATKVINYHIAKNYMNQTHINVINAEKLKIMQSINLCIVSHVLMICAPHVPNDCVFEIYMLFLMLL
jgi:hypothetical protein